MSEEKLRKVFAENLKRQLELHGKQPVDLVKDLGIPFSTVSNWINATKFPRMGKVELIAQYLGIKKSDLTEEAVENSEQPAYYTDPEAAKIAQEIFDDSDLHALFRAARGSKPENLAMAAELLSRLKGTNPDG